MLGSPRALRCAPRGRSRRVLLSAVAATVLALAGLPAVAAASVTIGPEEIVLSSTGAGAVITRTPFQIAFTNAEGHTVLSEVAPVDAPFTLPAGLPQSPSGPTTPALYAPLSFLVGADQPLTDSGGQLGGDLLEAQETGTEYSAREVLSATAAGEGVELTVATDDPSGRELQVTIAPQGSGAIRVSAVPSEPAGVAAMADSFSSSTSEAFHGFGGRHNALDQHGESFYNWVEQENLGNGAQEGAGETELTPDGPQAAYYVQSSFLSNDGYGFLLDEDALSDWRLDDPEQPDAWRTGVAAAQISYIVAPGGMTAAAATLTSLSGRQRVPPAWALGPMFDRETELGVTPSLYEQQVESDLREIVARHLPLSAYRIEGWGLLSTPFLESVIARLKALGIRPLLYFRPFVGEDTVGTERSGEYATAIAGGYVTRTAGGQPYIFSDDFGANGALIDFTNPAAVCWWRERIDAALELGAEGFMLDFGEQVQPGMHFSDGSTGAAMHNAYPILVQRVTREALEAYEALHPGRAIAFYTRSGYSGTPGSAAYENFNFPGDETTNWSEASGLASLTRDMLNRAIGGAYGYSTDIGGYYDIGPGRQATSRELFIRWAEWAALSPLFRLHGALSEEHTPWSKHIHAVGIYRELSHLHMSAEPLIAALWKQADETGVPVTRPLYLAYPDDPQAGLADQEWLLGPDVLVAPVVEKRASSRTAYFPSGCWRSPETGQEIVGPRYQSVAAGLLQLPFFFDCSTQPFKPSGRFRRALR